MLHHWITGFPKFQHNTVVSSSRVKLSENKYLNITMRTYKFAQGLASQLTVADYST
jgi:hypothetical protein